MKTMDYNQLEIRLARKVDLESLARIEAECFPVPWSLEDFRDMLVGGVASCRIATLHARPIGYVVYQPLEDMVLILNLAVMPRHRRHYVATSLVVDLMFRLDTQRRRRYLSAIIGADNTTMDELLRGLAFRAAGWHRGFYKCCKRDGVEMRYTSDWARGDE